MRISCSASQVSQYLMNSGRQNAPSSSISQLATPFIITAMSAVSSHCSVTRTWQRRICVPSIVKGIYTPAGVRRTECRAWSMLLRPRVPAVSHSPLSAYQPALHKHAGAVHDNSSNDNIYHQFRLQGFPRPEMCGLASYPREHLYEPLYLGVDVLVACMHMLVCLSRSSRRHWWHLARCCRSRHVLRLCPASWLRVGGHSPCACHGVHLAALLCADDGPQPGVHTTQWKHMSS